MLFMIYFIASLFKYCLKIIYKERERAIKEERSDRKIINNEDKTHVYKMRCHSTALKSFEHIL